MTGLAPASARRVRRGSDVALLVVGAALLVLTGLAVDPVHVSGPEASVFRAVNATTVLPFAVVWTVMQLGNVLVIPVAALVAAAFRRWWLAAGLLLAGAATYWLAKQVKRVVTRGRPHGLVPDVVIRGAEAHGLGFVSGHAAVLGALVTVAWPWFGRTGRVVACVLLALVALARVYVGAHLPLDVVGGAALGVAVGGAVRLLVGRPA